MYCISCGIALPDNARFCSNCGTAAGQITKSQVLKETGISESTDKIENESVTEYDRFTGSPEKKLIGVFCLVGGFGSGLYGMIRMNSAAVQFAGAFGVKDNVWPLFLTGGIVLAIIGLLLILQRVK